MPLSHRAVLFTATLIFVPFTMAIPEALALDASMAQQQSVRTYNIPAGSLSTVLSRFAGESGLTLSSRAQLTDDRTSSGLQGDFTVEQALQRLLENTGIHYRFSDAEGITLVTGNPQEGDEKTSLGTLTVTGTFMDDVHAYTREQNRLGALDNDIVLDGERLRRHPDEHIGKALVREPGIFGTPPNSKEDIRLRGLDKQFTRVSVAGVGLPVTQRGRNFEVGTLGSALAGEVQVIRNPTADVQSDGIGGRVNVDFREIPETTGGGAYAIGDTLFEGDSFFDEELVGGRGGAYFGGPIDENWSALGGIDIRADPRLTKFRNEAVNADGSFNERETRQDRSDDTFITSLLRLRWQGEAGTAEIQPVLLLRQKTKTDQRDSLNAKGDEDNRFKTEDSQTITSGVKLSWDHGLLPEQWSWRSHVATYIADEEGNNGEIRQRTGKDVENKNARPELTDKTFELESRLGREWHTALPGRTEVGVFARGRDRDAEANNFKDGVAQAPGTGDVFSLDERLLATWIRHEVRFLDERFKVEPGLRVENYDLDVDTLAADGSPRADDNSHSHVNPSLHLAYRPIDSLRFNAAVSRTLNRPEFDQIIPFDEDPKKGEIKRGNTGLDPATSVNVDLGVLWATPTASLGATVFYKDIDDLIVEANTGEIEDGNAVIRPQNAEGGKLRGVELEQRLDLGRVTGAHWMEGLGIWANQTIFDGEATLVSGKKVPFSGEPDYLLRVGIDYVHPGNGLNIALSYNRNGERIEEDDTTRKVFEPENTLDLAVSYPLAKGASLRFEATNLLSAEEDGDKEFFDSNGNLDKVDRRTVAVTRRISLGLKWDF
ncbi:TonB-dependent receptor [Halomonas llamarensis]|uniref:TonB-dependent receptor n=1 Tax=Halomonas llamarensis TaxID=2945104 RepID=A0ABT0SRB0_9GAMM|nr:TonB-dependent receptor [Halomonas llamarensis]MCL7930357.1 TonB-dependent receptor [Halomonas llamarensis]